MIQENFSKEDMFDFYRWLNKNFWKDYDDIKKGLFVNLFGEKKQEIELLEIWSNTK